jgi:hypothetical protein
LRITSRRVVPDIHFSKQRGGTFFTFGVSPYYSPCRFLDLLIERSSFWTRIFFLIFLYYRSDPQASQVLAKGDVVKIQLGAHIDGYAAISGETIVVGANAENPVTGRRADVLKAAWTAAEVAMRTLKVGNKNWAVTEIVGRSSSVWDCKPVEG